MKNIKTMLIRELYELLKVELDENRILAEIELNPNHDIYRGHFPGQPILPGVLQLQIVKEILASALEKNIHLKSASNIKFLSMVDPRAVNSLQLEIEIISEIEDVCRISAKIHSGNTVFLRFKGVYTFA